ncbi:serine, glycine and glutamine-rich protein-like, partial [Penaeus monodon]|uniref:serine, glycine and glutamine-rich protein-like n=1 Tax=Penaeus monodon TaxID=6687 RepID=UPI0018A736B4
SSSSSSILSPSSSSNKNVCRVGWNNLGEIGPGAGGVGGWGGEIFHAALPPWAPPLGGGLSNINNNMGGGVGALGGGVGGLSSSGMGGLNSLLNGSNGLSSGLLSGLTGLTPTDITALTSLTSLNGLTGGFSNGLNGINSPVNSSSLNGSIGESFLLKEVKNAPKGGGPQGRTGEKGRFFRRIPAPNECKGKMVSGNSGAKLRPEASNPRIKVYPKQRPLDKPDDRFFGPAPKVHPQHLCEKCKSLGYYCRRVN